ncbi:hypothetical protein AUJ17_05510 [Candidatus Micrarchaeota archaeon CG1_02_47_40]|nr:MAG: hypothetical protein AUJ17_05510 [Candidatus Micrarchaeota archaeon CG1_02_47_40]
MDEALFSRVLINSRNLINEAVKYPHKRYLYNTLARVPEGFFCGVCGLRGIGKTVLLLQLAGKAQNPLYLSADAHYLAGEDLYELIRFCSERGYKNLFIDEIHYKKEWKESLKTAYDEGLARVFFSGSSALEIRGGADLSRRALIYKLNPLSFREYLAIKKGMPHEAIPQAELFDFQKRKEIIEKTSSTAAFFAEYCRLGGLLYPSSDEQFFYKAVESALDKTIRMDMAYLRGIEVATEQELYKLIQRIALSPPGEASYSSLASKVSLSKPSVISAIDCLVKIGVVLRVLPCGKAAARKEPKLYLAPPLRHFICSSLSVSPDAGSLREEFFVSHAEKTCYLKGKRGEKTPDFLFGGKKIEIGGSSKNFRQNPDFIFEEGITFEERRIPLYLAGFLY